MSLKALTKEARGKGTKRMRQGVIQSVKSDIITKADKLADELSKNIKCSGVFVSLANNRQLFSVGMAKEETSDNNARLHNARDSLCAITVSKNEPLVLNDARSYSETSEIPYVAAGHIVGYLGQPIRDMEDKAIGAICAISSTPRIWSQIDVLSLKNTCLEAEKLIANAIIGSEDTTLTRSLNEYDNILGSMAVNADFKVSIHNERGDLLFATNALLACFDHTFLQDQVREGNKRQSLVSEPRKPVRSRRDTKNEYSSILCFTDNASQWIAKVKKCSTGTVFVCWESEPIKNLH